jgi:uncharacterized protein (TIGR02246 family)
VPRLAAVFRSLLTAVELERIMKNKRRWLASGLILTIAVAGLMVSRENPSALAGDPPARTADESAIRKASQEFVRAFEKGDVKAVGALFTEEGEYVDETAETIRGRAALEKAYAKFFKERVDVKAAGKTDRIRFLSKETAIEEGTFTVQAKDRPAETNRFSALYVRQDGKWLIALMKEWPDGAPPATLDGLAWLVGSWESDGPDLKATTTYEWAENKKFLKCHFSIHLKKDGSKTSSGTQYIGVDPAVGTIRSWTFDSDGGVGEATWSFDGSRWAIHSHATLASGVETTALNLLTKSADSAFTWRSVERTLGGAALPDIASVKVRRVAAGK